MNILFIAPIQIHANSSAGAETINLYINELAKQNNKIRVIAIDEGRFTHPNIKYVKLKQNLEKNAFFSKLYKGFGWIFYPQSKYLYKTLPKQRKEIFQILNTMKMEGYDPDTIMLETTSTILLVEKIKKIFPKALCVASLHDFAFQGSQRKAALEQSRIKKIIRNRYLKKAEYREIQALEHAHIIAPHNSGNVEILQKYDSLKNKKIFPIVPYYADEYVHNDMTQSYDLLFYGLMNRPENYTAAEWFIENVMPHLPEQYRFIVLGGKPTAELLKKKSERIIVTGFVSEKVVKEYFEQSMALVVPLLFGSGIKTKILTAMSAGLPVITNAIGIEGIDAKVDVEYRYCETPEEYVETIKYIKQNIDEYLVLCNSSREFMKTKYNKKLCGRELNKLLHEFVLKES